MAQVVYEYLRRFYVLCGCCCSFAREISQQFHVKYRAASYVMMIYSPFWWPSLLLQLLSRQSESRIVFFDYSPLHLRHNQRSKVVLIVICVRASTSSAMIALARFSFPALTRPFANRITLGYEGIKSRYLSALWPIRKKERGEERRPPPSANPKRWTFNS